MNKLLNFTSLMSLMLLVSGCGLLYDCEAAEAEISTLETEFVSDFVIGNCTPYVDKRDEYVDEGCGDVEDLGGTCEELVCTYQYSTSILTGLNMLLLAADSAAYCEAYDSVGVNMQNMVDAGGCASYTGLPAYTQAMVDEYVEAGCDYEPLPTSSVGNPSFPFEKISKKEMINIINDQVSMLPEEYGAKIMRQLERFTSL